MSILNIAAYRFVSLNALSDLQTAVRQALDGSSIRGTVLLVHGLGEHTGRYGHVAEHLRQWGFAARGYDHQGHGHSDGARGTLQTEDGLLQDLATVIDHTRERPGAQEAPLILLGHSMGGLVSKGQVQESGDRLWVNLLGDTPEKLGLTKTERDALSSYMEFDPNPSVSRVIFAATPHRGSKVADSRIAHFGRRLISLPGRRAGGGGGSPAPG